MIIIFEGHDNAGKTTIAKALAEKLGFQYFKHHRSDEYFFDIHDRSYIYTEAFFLADFLTQINVDVIIDRHIPSEFVYGEQYKRDVNYRALTRIDDYLGKLGVILIVCEKDISSMVDFVDSYVKKDELESIKHLYRKYCSFSSMNHLLLDTTNMNLELQLNNITTFISVIGGMTK